MTVLSKIFVYPIKALPGVLLDTVSITEGGALNNDRRWAIVDENGRMVNGKNNSRVFSLRPAFNLNDETVSFVDVQKGHLTFQLGDMDSLSTYFSEKLKKPVFLKEDKRQGFPDDLNASGPTIVSQASLEAVASWYPGLSVDDVRARFRINLEVSPAPAFWEDQVFKQDFVPSVIRIGKVAIQSSNPCARCSVPMKHQETGERYEDFYQTFIDQREKARPEWTEAACFDHWYRLSVNTTIDSDQSGREICLGDAVSLDGCRDVD